MHGTFRFPILLKIISTYCFYAQWTKTIILFWKIEDDKKVICYSELTLIKISHSLSLSLPFFISLSWYYVHSLLQLRTMLLKFSTKMNPLKTFPDYTFDLTGQAGLWISICLFIFYFKKNKTKTSKQQKNSNNSNLGFQP